MVYGACQPPEKPREVVALDEPSKLYCDTLFSFALNLAIEANNSDFKGLLIFNRLRDFSDTTVFIENPSLIDVYEESIELYPPKQEVGQIEYCEIDTSCYSTSHFCTQKDLDIWRRWYQEENDSTQFMPVHFLSFSKPLLSADGKHIAIELTYNSNGFGGYGMSYLFINENGVWKLSKTNMLWVS